MRWVYEKSHSILQLFPSILEGGAVVAFCRDVIRHYFEKRTQHRSSWIHFTNFAFFFF